MHPRLQPPACRTLDRLQPLTRTRPRSTWNQTQVQKGGIFGAGRDVLVRHEWVSPTRFIADTMPCDGEAALTLWYTSLSDRLWRRRCRHED